MGQCSALRGRNSECSSLPLQAGTKSLWDTVITGLLFQTFKKEWTHVCPWKSLVPVKIPGRLWSWTASPNSFVCYPALTYSRINSTAARISTGSYSYKRRSSPVRSPEHTNMSHPELPFISTFPINSPSIPCSLCLFPLAHLSLFLFPLLF